MSDAVGFFTSPPVQPGEFKVSAAASGFAPWEGRLTLQVGQTATVEPVLQLASSTSTITVAGDVTFYAVFRQNPPFDALFTTDWGSSSQSPDGLPNFNLRNTPRVIAGLNSRDMIDLDSPNAVTRGSFPVA